LYYRGTSIATAIGYTGRMAIRPQDLYP